MDTDLTTTNDTAVAGTDAGNAALVASTSLAILALVEQTLLERVATQADTLNTRALIDMGEHAFKVSGLAKKQEAKDDTGKFVFNIIMGDGNDIKTVNDLVGTAVEVEDDENRFAVLVEQANVLAVDEPLVGEVVDAGYDNEL